VSRGWLGVSVAPHLKGVQVTSVVEHSPAAEAGILLRDVISEFNGTQVHTFAKLNKLVTSMRPDTDVIIKVLRENTYIQTEVTLGRKR